MEAQHIGDGALEVDRLWRVERGENQLRGRLDHRDCGECNQTGPSSHVRHPFVARSAWPCEGAHCGRLRSKKNNVSLDSKRKFS